MPPEVHADEMPTDTTTGAELNDARGPQHPGDVEHEPHGADDHGEDHGHDDHAHASETLGPLDSRAWGAAVLGILLGLIIALAMAASAS